MAGEFHPATTTLILLSLMLMCGVPFIAWLALGKTENPTAAKLWFGGLALNALAIVLLLYADGSTKALQVAASQGMTMVGLLMTGSALRLSLGGGGLPGWLWLCLPGAAFVATLAVVGAGAAYPLLRALFFLCSGALLAWITLEALRVHADCRSRPMLLVAVIFGVVCAATFVRSFAFLLFDMSPLLTSFSPTAMAGWALNVSAVVLCSFGYWSFALERAYAAELKARQEGAAARARAEEAEAHSKTLGRLIRERDEMIMLNSRMTGLTGVSIFGAGLVHELNQYLEALTARLGAAHLMAPEAHQALRAQILEASTLTETISASIRPLRDLLVSGSPRVEPVDVAIEIDGLARIVANECARRDIRFEIDVAQSAVSRRCFCDPVLLRRIFINLVTNAMQELLRTRDARDGAPDSIRIRVDLERKDDETMLRLEVRDNGPGFPADMLEQPLRLLRTDKEQGIGLGLVLTDMVLSSWKGTMSLTNDAGACVTIAIPVIGVAMSEAA